MHNWHSHSDLKGSHAFLSPSKYSWLGYDTDKLLQAYSKHQATQKGVVLHDFAKMCIDLRQRLPALKNTLNMFVNDGIGFIMQTEQPLYFSPHCFGTADAISYREGVLRIHDLKTGISTPSIQQLNIYAGLFCLEYSVAPEKVEIILRIYYDNKVLESKPRPKLINSIMEKIITFSKNIDTVLNGGIE